MTFHFFLSSSGWNSKHGATEPYNSNIARLLQRWCRTLRSPNMVMHLARLLVSPKTGDLHRGVESLWQEKYTKELLTNLMQESLTEKHVKLLLVSVLLWYHSEFDKSPLVITVPLYVPLYTDNWNSKKHKRMSSTNQITK